MCHQVRWKLQWLVLYLHVRVYLSYAQGLQVYWFACIFTDIIIGYEYGRNFENTECFGHRIYVELIGSYIQNMGKWCVLYIQTARLESLYAGHGNHCGTELLQTPCISFLMVLLGNVDLLKISYWSWWVLEKADTRSSIFSCSSSTAFSKELRFNKLMHCDIDLRKG